MKKLYPIILFVMSCGSSNQNSEAIKQKELELKERELDLKEREIQALEVNKKTVPNSNGKQARNREVKRELRYLYYANGGIIGYFDDGTVAGCPRCDFSKNNILAMFKEKPYATYTVGRDGSLILSNGNRETPDVNDDRGWALIDYKWNQKVPQY